MEFKNYKMSTMAFGNVNMPVDPKIESFIASSFSAKLDQAMIAPFHEQIHQPINERPLDYVCVNIDDLLGFLRDMRKAGFSHKRGITAMGSKGNFFYVWDAVRFHTRFTVMVDVWRHIPRGQMITFGKTAYHFRGRY